MAKKPRTIYTDRTTGQQVYADVFFENGLLRTPNLLSTGAENARHVPSILAALGCTYTDDKAGRKQLESDSRQLRYAKERLVAEGKVLIISSSGAKGGYFYPASMDEVIPDIKACEAMADGFERRAKELRALAEKQFGVSSSEEDKAA